MRNLIQNSQWRPGPKGERRFFGGCGYTYDDCTIGGCRTCSVTMQGCEGEKALDVYEPAIRVCGQKAICWGYTIRAIEACSITLVADFYGCNGKQIKVLRHSVAGDVGCQFETCVKRFEIPEGAKTVRLCMEMNGKVTACTYYAPTAYFD